MTKAAFFMQEHLRRNFAYISDLHYPNAFFCRGRLSFPQGMTAVAVLFHDKTPADVYAHPYFVEKQSDPSQPSPQLHITEELQGVIKIMRGLRYMKDNSSKLDDTMAIVTDYEEPVRGRLLFVETTREREAARAEEVRAKEERNRALKPETDTGGGGDGPNITFSSSLASDSNTAVGLPASGGGTGEITPEERAGLLQRRIASRAFVTSFMHSGAAGGGGASTGPTPGRMGGGSGGMGGGGDLGGGMGSSRRGLGGGSTSTPGSLTGGSSSSSSSSPAGPAATAEMTFPTVGETLSARGASYRFFRSILTQRKADSAVSAPIPPPQVHLTEPRENDEDDDGLFVTRLGGFTVMYNPIETNDRTVSDVMAKLNEEEKVVQIIVVPTRHAWRQVQLWADAFPDAQIISSGPIPVLAANGLLTDTGKITDAMEAAERWRLENPEAAAAAAAGSGGGGDGINCSAPSPTGMQEFSNGQMGMSFPEVDLDAEADEAAAAARNAAAVRQHRGHEQQAWDDDRLAAAAGNRARAGGEGAAGSVSPGVLRAAAGMPSIRIAAMLEERERMHRAMERREAEQSKGSSKSNDQHQHQRRFRHAADDQDEREAADPVDVLWSAASRDIASNAAGFSGDPVAEERRFGTGAIGGLREADAVRVRDLSRLGSPDVVRLTDAMELLRVKGDAITDEYVLYDRNSRALYCTDLFHGQYADLDPLNTWMCRVWFKFMKQGNHKRVDIAPRFKWRQVCGQGSLGELQSFVDSLTRTREIVHIVQSHGSPPFSNDAANVLRLQWDLDPLPPKAPPRQSSRDPFFDWEAQQDERNQH